MMRVELWNKLQSCLVTSLEYDLGEVDEVPEDEITVETIQMLTNVLCAAEPRT
jgi:hypothetical protein